MSMSGEMLAFDREHIWHPYTSITAPLPVYPVKGASGVRITLEDGTELIDGVSSWWSAIHGYNHPVLNTVAKAQIEKMSHIMFGGFTHQPAVDIAQLLVKYTPASIQKVFFCDSGSVAVEVSIKMALQYWHAKGKPQKNKMLTLRGGYHGDTFMAMSVCDPIDSMHHVFTGILHKHFFANMPVNGFDTPFKEEYLNAFSDIISQHHDKIAAVIVEPILQGAGGMRIYSPEYLKRMRQLCDAHDVLLIFDEVATGFGRTGTLFAQEHADVCPDIMCIGKALTGGFMSLAATLSTNTVAEGICSGEPHLFMHGPTFMANPLACAVAVANLNLLFSYDWKKKVKEIEQQMKQELEPCRALKQVADVRVIGAVGVVELKQKADVATMQKTFIKKGVWIRPFENIVYIMPPYIISQEELSMLTQAMYSVIKES